MSELKALMMHLGLSFGVSAILAYPIFRTLLAMKSRQNVSQHLGETHQVKQGTPTMGGIIVLVGLIPTLVILQHAALITLVAGFALIGFLDDYWVPKHTSMKRGLPWRHKLVLQFLFAGLAAWLEQRSFGLSFFLEGFLILFLANAYNFADGLDGLAGGLLLLIAVGLAGISNLFGLQGITWPICAAFVGGLIPFLFINAPPAKIFMGDVGSLPLGATLGWIVCRLLLETAARPVWLAWTVMVIVGAILIVELVMVPLQIAWVKLFKRRLFLCTPVHHAFEKLGWPETRIVASFCLSQIVLNCVGFALALGFFPQGGQP